MGYQRAQWHSGLTYQTTCEECKTVIRYTDQNLGFRPWFPDGFVYCPRCKKPLRHRESNAIDENTGVPLNKSGNAFCTQCGHQVRATDKFCAKCGKQL